jgi:hypothetical protein
MEEILNRIANLEKRIAELENKNVNDVSKNEYNDFITTIGSFCVDEKNLINIFNTSLIDEIIKIILNKNKEQPFLQYKKQVYKYENKIMHKMEDDYYIKLFNHIEYLIIQEFNLYSNKNKNSEQFFEKSKIIYGLNINKNFKKIKSLFLQAL